MALRLLLGVALIALARAQGYESASCVGDSVPAEMLMQKPMFSEPAAVPQGMQRSAATVSEDGPAFSQLSVGIVSEAGDMLMQKPMFSELAAVPQGMQRSAATVSEDGEVLLQQPAFSQLSAGIVSEAGDSMIQRPFINAKQKAAVLAPTGDSFFQGGHALNRAATVASEVAEGHLLVQAGVATGKVSVLEEEEIDDSFQQLQMSVRVESVPDTDKVTPLLAQAGIASGKMGLFNLEDEIDMSALAESVPDTDDATSLQNGIAMSKVVGVLEEEIDDSFQQMQMSMSVESVPDDGL